MNERLLTCRLCGGTVSSRADSCPHCGSTNFKPDSYLREERAEYDAQSRLQYLQLVKKQLADYGVACFPPSVPYDVIRANFPDEAIISVHMEKTTPQLELGCGEYLSARIGCMEFRHQEGVILPAGKYQISVLLGYRDYDRDFIRRDDKELKITVAPSSQRLVIEYGLCKGLLYGNLKLKNVKARVE